MEFLDESCYYTDFFIHVENRRYTLKNVYCHQPIFFVDIVERLSQFVNVRVEKRRYRIT